MELKPTWHHLNHMCLVKPTFLWFIIVSDGQITMCKLVNPPNCSVFYPRLFWLPSPWFPQKKNEVREASPAGPRRGGIDVVLVGTYVIASGKHTKNYGESPFFMGKLTISMAIFNSYVSLPEGNWGFMNIWDYWLLVLNWVYQLWDLIWFIPIVTNPKLIGELLRTIWDYCIYQIILILQFAIITPHC